MPDSERASCPFGSIVEVRRGDESEKEPLGGQRLHKEEMVEERDEEGSKTISSSSSIGGGDPLGDQTDQSGS